MALCIVLMIFPLVVFFLCCISKRTGKVETAEVTEPSEVPLYTKQHGFTHPTRSIRSVIPTNGKRFTRVRVNQSPQQVWDNESGEWVYLYLVIDILDFNPKHYSDIHPLDMNVNEHIYQSSRQSILDAVNETHNSSTSYINDNSSCSSSDSSSSSSDSSSFD